MNMNQADIEAANRNNHACPNVKKGFRLLFDLMTAVNNQSDGWHSWSAPSKAAEPLMKLLRTAGNIWYDTHGTITEQQLKQAVTPIRRMVTFQKKKQAQYGNTFDFDVDASLKSLD